MTQSKLCYWKPKQSLIIGWRWLSGTLLARQHQPAGFAHAAFSPPNLIFLYLLFCLVFLKNKGWFFFCIVPPGVSCYYLQEVFNSRPAPHWQLCLERRIHSVTICLSNSEIAIYSWVPHIKMLLFAELNADGKHWCQQRERNRFLQFYQPALDSKLASNSRRNYFLAILVVIIWKFSWLQILVSLKHTQILILASSLKT